MFPESTNMRAVVKSMLEYLGVGNSVPWQRTSVGKLLRDGLVSRCLQPSPCLVEGCSLFVV